MKPIYILGAGHYGVLTVLDCEQRGIAIKDKHIIDNIEANLISKGFSYCL